MITKLKTFRLPGDKGEEIEGYEMDNDKVLFWASVRAIADRTLAMLEKDEGDSTHERNLQYLAEGIREIRIAVLPKTTELKRLSPEDVIKISGIILPQIRQELFLNNNDGNYDYEVKSVLMTMVASLEI